MHVCHRVKKVLEVLNCHRHNLNGKNNLVLTPIKPCLALFHTEHVYSSIVSCPQRASMTFEHPTSCYMFSIVRISPSVRSDRF